MRNKNIILRECFSTELGLDFEVVSRNIKILEKVLCLQHLLGRIYWKADPRCQIATEFVIFDIVYIFRTKSLFVFKHCLPKMKTKLLQRPHPSNDSFHHTRKNKTVHV